MSARLDAHHHLWDLARPRPFLDGDGMTAIRRDYGLPELRDVIVRCGVDATILVQTLADEAETVEFLSLAEESAGLIAGVVGWVDLTDADVHGRLAALRRTRGGALLRGVRHAAQAEPDPCWLDRADVRRGIAAVGQAGLTYDLLVKQPQWAAALRLARAFPDVPMVIDHAGNPPVDDDLGLWSRWLANMASLPNVCVKLSGLLTLGARSAEAVWPVADRVLSTFGPHRVMAGSDWPVCELSTPAEVVWWTHESFTRGLTDGERAAVFAGTAQTFYLTGADRTSTGRTRS
ncbi:amidohydrolase family protein [Nonomuraea sp. NPDC000554]|uniref:amidohydrolase family protein n=1 Tax=Nonomuraea sp. NPDC000554 TaxID=3154259 RepID=UPI0033349C39